MEYNVIDADGHVLEPPDLWENYIEPRFREICPKVLITEDGREVLRIEGDDGIDLGRGKKPLTLGGCKSSAAFPSSFLYRANTCRLAPTSSDSAGCLIFFE